MANSLEDMPNDVAAELAKLARDLSVNPETRKPFLRLAKQVRKELPTPEIDAEDAAQSALAEARKEIAALKSSQQADAAKAELESRRKKIVESGKATLEDIPAIEKMMLEKGMTNHETAADHFNWMRQAEAPAKPSSYRGNVLDGDTRKTLAPYFKNATQAARDNAAQALAELRSGRVRLQ